MQQYDPSDYGYCPHCMSNPHKARCPEASEPEHIDYCALCDNPIKRGETVYIVAEEYYHKDCFDDEYCFEY